MDVKIKKYESASDNTKTYYVGPTNEIQKMYESMREERIHKSNALYSFTKQDSFIKQRNNTCAICVDKKSNRVTIVDSDTILYMIIIDAIRPVYESESSGITIYDRIRQMQSQSPISY